MRSSCDTPRNYACSIISVYNDPLYRGNEGYVTSTEMYANESDYQRKENGFYGH